MSDQPMSDPPMSDPPMICPLHPEDKVVALCVVCGRPVCAACRHLDEARCAVCPEHATLALVKAEEAAVKVAAEAAEAEGAPSLPVVAWEAPNHPGGDLLAFFHSARAAVLSPMRFMYTIPWARRDYRSPLFFALICGALGYLPILAHLYYAPPPLVLPPEVKAVFGDISLFKMALFALPLLPVVLSVMLLLQAGLTHLLLTLSGSAKRPFEATFRTFAYAQASNLLLFLPGIGYIAQSFYLVFFLLGGIRVAHKTGVGGALLALVPILLQQSLFSGGL